LKTSPMEGTEKGGNYQTGVMCHIKVKWRLGYEWGDKGGGGTNRAEKQNVIRASTPPGCKKKKKDGGGGAGDHADCGEGEGGGGGPSKIRRKEKPIFDGLNRGTERVIRESTQVSLKQV